MQHPVAVSAVPLEPVVPQPPPAWLMRLVTPFVRRLLRSPLATLMGDRLVLLEFSGRRTGRVYALPVAATHVGDVLLVATDKRWKANLRGGAPLSVLTAGRRRSATADVVADLAGMAERYASMMKDNPQVARFVGLRADADGRPLPADVARAAAAGHAVVAVRLHPDLPSSAGRISPSSPPA